MYAFLFFVKAKLYSQEIEILNSSGEYFIAQLFIFAPINNNPSSKTCSFLLNDNYNYKRERKHPFFLPWQALVHSNLS